ncbi:MAG: hypothetical protein QOJ70_2953 [Acidobacteriota bacterium]|nr:hypothetical protein [Acidobacteriota bacterium]
MRKAISAAALILALTCSARAGWMPNGEQAPPPPPPPLTNNIQEPTTKGAIAARDVPDDSADLLTQTTLDLLVTLQSLF